jgi:hypothetical protein
MTERKRVLSRAGLVLVASIAASAFGVASAWAVTITEPSGSPVVAPVDPAGHLAPLPVSATGFPVRTAVYVEECDGTGPTMPRWDPTEHCDLASSPAAAYADADGSVTFSASRAFVPFVGESPQSLFNCLPNGSPSPSNGLPSFTNCQVRVSSNNSAVTADQRFFGLRLPANAANPPPRTTTTTTKPRAGVASNNVTTTTRMTAAVPVRSRHTARRRPRCRPRTPRRAVPRMRPRVLPPRTIHPTVRVCSGCPIRPSRSVTWCSFSGSR